MFQHPFFAIREDSTTEPWGVFRRNIIHFGDHSTTERFFLLFSIT